MLLCRYMGCSSIFVFKQKTAYDMRISDWSSDVCSSDLYARERTAFGRAIGEFQGMRWKLAEMYRDIEAARSLLYRSEERRVGKECVSTCKSRWSPSPYKTNTSQQFQYFHSNAPHTYTKNTFVARPPITSSNPTIH